MNDRVSLNGDDWSFKDFYGADWVWRDACAPDTKDVRWWGKGTVPGSVLDDVWHAGEIADPYIEKNSLLCEWVHQRTWIYKKSFFAGVELSGKRVQLVFLGVDYSAQFYLNGEYLGSHSGMFTPVAFDVSQRLHIGAENLLAVVIEAAPQEESQVGYTSKVHTHKSRMGYWWDFCPRLIHQGIWQDVYLEVSGDVRISDVFIQTTLNDAYEQARLSIAIDFDAQEETFVDVELIIPQGDSNQSVTHETIQLPGGLSQHLFNTTLENPTLWWPNGYGLQNLYEAVVRVYSQDNISYEKHVTFGIRKIRMLPNENAPADALPYTFEVNGRKLYIKGWNWVPIDALYGVPRHEKLMRLLALAKRANVNMLRVWGGGLIETEEFYAACDRLGILVWQEFIQSSSGIENTPSDAVDFINFMKSEAEKIIPWKRNHPSLAVWCGGNELQSGDGTPLDDSCPTLSAIKSVVKRLDPERVWLPTSPSGPIFGNTLRDIQTDPTRLHDVHGPWEYQGTKAHYHLYNQGSSLFHSEFGVEGITNPKSLDRVMAKENQWPVSKDENPYWWHLGAWWVQRSMWDQVFGRLDTVKAYVQATQFLQFEGLRYAVESDRRRMFHNSGTLPWQFNEPYPMAASTSAVDYFAQPKPVYYGVAKAYQPIHVSARYDRITWEGREQFISEIWVCNSLLSAVPIAVLSTRLVGASGKVYGEVSKTVSFGGNHATYLGRVQFNLESSDPVFFLDLSLRTEEQELLTKNRYVFTNTEKLDVLLKVPETTISVISENSADIWDLLVRNDGRRTAMNVWLQDGRQVGCEGFVYFDNNYFCLFPGESCRVKADWHRVELAQRRLEIVGWNTPSVVISCDGK